jgi:aminoglycoside phosphotransferase (APT) family kinase protein
MTAVDPRDPTAVADAVLGWAKGRFGGEVELAEPPSAVGAGFDSYIHLLRLRGAALPEPWRKPLVVRILPSVDRAAQASAEAVAQGWAADGGYPAPRVLKVLAPADVLGLPVQIMERAPGVTMLDALRAKPWRALSFVDQLAGLQLRLHALDPTTWPGSHDPLALVDARLRLTRRAAAHLDDPALASALERAEAMAPACASGADAVVCHGDLHPLNVMVDGTSASVIDWSDAGLGQREGDVARTALLFEVAAIAAGTRVERWVLGAAGPRLSRRHLRAYGRQAPLDRERLRRWEALHALHGWAQIAMLHAGAFDGDSSSSGDEARVPLALADWLRARFEATVT